MEKKSSMPPNNFLREESKGIIDDVFKIGNKYVKHQTVYWFFNKFFKPRLDNIILVEASIEDIKDTLFAVKKRIDRLSKMIDTVEDIKSSPTDAAINKKIEQMPGFKKLLEMFD